MYSQGQPFWEEEKYDLVNVSEENSTPVSSGSLEWLIREDQKKDW